MAHNVHHAVLYYYRRWDICIQNFMISLGALCISFEVKVSVTVAELLLCTTF